MSVIVEILQESAQLWLELAPYLFLGMVIAGLLHVFLGKEFISRQLGRGGWSSIIKATVFGIPLPVCSCGVIPLASSLRKDGAHKSSVLSFLVSTPTTGIDSIAATYSLLGPLFAMFRFLGALLAGIVVGIVDYIFEGRYENLKIMPSHAHQKRNAVSHFKKFITYTFFEIPQDIGKWLLVGTFLGGMITVVIPNEVFAQYIGFPGDIALALILGVPLYVCATGSIPIAVSLIAKGFSPAAALVFLIVGPATNAITLSFVRAKLGRKSFYIYLASIIVTAVLLGLVFNQAWLFFGKNTSLLTGGGQMISLIYKEITAVMLLLIIAFAYFKPSKKQLVSDLVIEVSDIHCSHCKTSLEEALRGARGVRRVSVDIEKKEVHIEGNPDQQQIREIIVETGYRPV